jgi:hypothetical protein
VRLILISDYPGHYESEDNIPFVSNDVKRQPQVSRGKVSLLGFRNAGSAIRYYLEELRLDTFTEVWMTNAVRCDPEGKSIPDKHLKACVSSWLSNDLRVLDQYVPDVPILIAGSVAFRALQLLDARFKKLKLRNCRRTNNYRLGLHPLVFTYNPVAVGRSEMRVESDIELDAYNQYKVREVRTLPELPGSPVWQFRRDLGYLKDLL